MKRIREVVLKVVLFFIAWVIGVSIIPFPEVENPVMWRFLAELIPVLVTCFVTIIFWLVEKRQIRFWLINNWMRGIIIGSIVGIVWLAIPILILYVTHIIRFDGTNKVAMLGTWFISVLLNVIMQELLIRGYLYQMLKQKCNTIAATVVTTGIFTILHGGAFEEGAIPVLNVLMMSLFMTLLLEDTKSLWTPIMAHFVWNAVGSLVLNVGALADDYPHVINAVFTGNKIFSGGECKIEGSIIVLVINVVFITFILRLWMKKQNR